MSKLLFIQKSPSIVGNSSVLYGHSNLLTALIPVSFRFEIYEISHIQKHNHISLSVTI